MPGPPSRRPAARTSTLRPPQARPSYPPVTYKIGVHPRQPGGAARRRGSCRGESGTSCDDSTEGNAGRFTDRTEGETTAGFRRILVTEPDHPYLEAWWPPGHVLGWEHTFVNQARDLLTDIAAGTDPEPSFSDGLQVQRVLAAVEHSAAHGSAWTWI